MSDFIAEDDISLFELLRLLPTTTRQMFRPPENVEIPEPTGSIIIGRTYDNDLENVKSSDPTSTMIEGKTGDQHSENTESLNATSTMIEGKTDDQHSENVESSDTTSTMIEGKSDDQHSENVESSDPISTMIEGKSDDQHSENVESSDPTSTMIEGKTDDQPSENVESSDPTSTMIEGKTDGKHSETEIVESSDLDSTSAKVAGITDDKFSENVQISKPANLRFDGETGISDFKDVDDHCQKSRELMNHSSDRPNASDSSHPELAINFLETTSEQLQEKISKQKEEHDKSSSIAKKACSQEADRKSGGEILAPDAGEELTARVRRIEERFAIMEKKIGSQEIFPLTDNQVLYIYIYTHSFVHFSYFRIYVN